jgi:hypothetical protein
MAILKDIFRPNPADNHPVADDKNYRGTFALLSILFIWPLITIIYGAAIKEDYVFVRQWEWTNLLWICLAIPFLLLQEKAGLPAWNGRGFPATRKWLVPAAIGLGFALLDVLVIKVIMHPQVYETLPPFLQPFPYSLFLYPSGALDIEIFYRLIPLTLVALASQCWFSWETGQKILWLAVVLTSLREPLEQWPSGPVWLVAYSLLSGFAMNLFQGFCLVRYGFLGALAVRIGHYLLWHIGLGIYVQFMEHAQV